MRPHPSTTQRINVEVLAGIDVSRQGEKIDDAETQVIVQGIALLRGMVGRIEAEHDAALRLESSLMSVD